MASLTSQASVRIAESSLPENFYPPVGWTELVHMVTEGFPTSKEGKPQWTKLLNLRWRQTYYISFGQTGNGGESPQGHFYRD